MPLQTAGSSRRGLSQAPSNQMLNGVPELMSPTALRTTPVSVSMMVSERTPRMTAPTMPSAAPASLMVAAAAISSSMVAGTTPSRYVSTMVLVVEQRVGLERDGQPVGLCVRYRRVGRSLHP